MNDKVELTDAQLSKLLSLYRTVSDLSELTRQVFDNPELDGRTREGRAVRQALIDKGLRYKTTEKLPIKDIELTIAQKEFIRESAEEGNKAVDIAKVLFPEVKDMSPLNKEARVVYDYIQNECPDLAYEEEVTDRVYSPPNKIFGAVQKVNEYAGENLNIKKLTTKQRKNIESLLRFLKTPRLTQVINSFATVEDRKMLESEFIRFVWDKPDLTNEEITMYINVCIDLVYSKRVARHLDKLNNLFEEVENDEDLHMRLSDTIKAKSGEYNDIMKRVDSVLKKLNGSREDRLKKRQNQAQNFSYVVEAFQEKEERERILKINKAMALEVKEEADRIESLGEWLARIVGIEKDELI